MSLRARLVIAFGAVALVPLALLALGLRESTTRNLVEQYNARLEQTQEAVQAELEQQSDDIVGRLESLTRALQNDASFRAGAVADQPEFRGYVLDYASTAMALAGLSMLQIHDPEGRIISSGHFRNEHGRIDAATPRALAAAASGDLTLMTARSPAGEFFALAGARTLVISGRRFTLVGGVTVDSAFLGRLVADPDTIVVLRHDGVDVLAARERGAAGEAVASLDPLTSKTIEMRLLRPAGDTHTASSPAALVLLQPRTRLETLLRRNDRLSLAGAAAAVAIALVLALWVSARISRPLADLAEKTSVLDLDRLDVPFEGGADEVGRLSLTLGDLASRLRSSTSRVREAERRATVGELARQINHDIKNGLIPLRNVMRHLAAVQRDDPGSIAGVLAERRPTIDSSLAYLETLATNYERLAPSADRRDSDVNAVVVEVLRGAREHEHVELQSQLAPQLPRVSGSSVAMRRILENLIANGVDSLESRQGRITVTTERIDRDGEPALVRVTVADTGRGMGREEAARIFEDFYTTKEGGTGLGLSIVRRLVMDMHGTIRAESEPGRGSRMIVEIPAAAAPRPGSSSRAGGRESRAVVTGSQSA
jgi:signal transduction histidine kinase